MSVSGNIELFGFLFSFAYRGLRRHARVGIQPFGGATGLLESVESRLWRAQPVQTIAAGADGGAVLRNRGDGPRPEQALKGLVRRRNSPCGSWERDADAPRKWLVIHRGSTRLDIVIRFYGASAPAGLQCARAQTVPTRAKHSSAAHVPFARRTLLQREVVV